MSELKPIDERIAELKKEGKNNKEIVNFLYDEGYDTKSIMTQGFSLRWVKKQPLADDEDVQEVISGPPGRGLGYISELRELVRRQMSRSRQLTEIFYDLGLSVLLASLSKTGLTINEFSKIFSQEKEMREALNNAAQTAFKALDFYDVEAMRKLEKERDDARSYAVFLEQSIEKVSKDLAESLDPKMRLEKMIYNLVLTSGSSPVDPNALSALIDKWLTIEISLPLSRVISP